VFQAIPCGKAARKIPRGPGPRGYIVEELPNVRPAERKKRKKCPERRGKEVHEKLKTCQQTKPVNGHHNSGFSRRVERGMTKKDIAGAIHL